MKKARLAMAMFCGLCSAGGFAQPAPQPELPTLWIIGDSTVRNNTPGQQGWGGPIAQHFDPARIRVANRAIGGRSSRTFISDGRWDAILAEAKAGDYVLIQFGHNDGAPLDDPMRSRGTIRGIGDESQEIFNPIRNTQEVVRTYGWYLRKYCTDAKAAGVVPIVLSYVPRCPKPGTPMPVSTELTTYGLWAKQAAEQTGAHFIDLFGRVLEEYNQLSPEEIKSRYFSPADDTHTSPAGAALNAARVVDGIRALDGCALKDCLGGVPPGT